VAVTVVAVVAVTETDVPKVLLEAVGMARLCEARGRGHTLISLKIYEAKRDR
jgi:hypothetical protein